MLETTTLQNTQSQRRRPSTTGTRRAPISSHIRGSVRTGGYEPDVATERVERLGGPVATRAGAQRTGARTYQAPRSQTKTQRVPLKEQPVPPRHFYEAHTDDLECDSYGPTVDSDPHTLPPVLYQAPKRQLHPIIYVAGTIATLAGLWLAGTAGASWFCTQITDPATYGPQHGVVTTIDLKKGTVTSLSAENDNGHVFLLEINNHDLRHAQIHSILDLTTIDFPDAPNAEVDLQVGDFNHDGLQDVKVVIYSSEFPLPLTRFHRNLVLSGDGKGGLKSAVDSEAAK